MAILEQNRRRGVASLRLQFAVAAVAVLSLVPLSSLTWAGPQAGASGVVIHEHVHEAENEYQASDSEVFERHLTRSASTSTTSMRYSSASPTPTR